MKIEVSNKILFPLILGGIIAIFLLGGWLGLRRGDRASNVAQNALNEQITTYKAKIRQDSVIIVLSEQEVLSQKKALKQLGLDNADLKKLNLRLTNNISELRLDIDSLIKVPHTGKIVVVHDTITESGVDALLLPFGFEKKDKYLDLSGHFDENAELSVNLKMEIDLDIISGVNRETKKPSIAAFTDNLYVNRIGIRSFKTDVQKPHRWGIGLIGGYGMSINAKPTASPFAGVGVSYNFVTF
jgi:hypothetical protein